MRNLGFVIGVGLFAVVAVAVLYYSISVASAAIG